MLSRTKPAEKEARIVTAIQEVTDSAVELARKQVELAKAEAIADVTSYARQTRMLGIALGLFLLGAAFLTLGIVLTAGYFAGQLGMLIASFAVAVVYIAIAVRVAYVALMHIRAHDAMMSDTKKELRRSVEWVKQIAKM